MMNFYHLNSVDFLLFSFFVVAIPIHSFAVFKPIADKSDSRHLPIERVSGHHPNQIPYVAESPFHRNEKEISKIINNLISNNRDLEAFQVMKKVIASEKKWRFNLCLHWFGKSSCSKGINLIEPFFIWKKKLVHELLMDPTEEIIKTIRENIEFQ